MRESNAGQGLRTSATILVLALVLLLGGLWGWSAVTDPFPGRGSDDDECTQVAVSAGDRVKPGMVTVSVLNGSGRTGLAAQTMRELLTYGFGEGDLGNTPQGTKVPRVQIWTNDPDSPAVALVSRYVAGRDGKPANIVERDPPLIGVNVVLGDRFKSVVKGPKRVVAESDVSFCGPTAVAAAG